MEDAFEKLIVRHGAFGPLRERQQPEKCTGKGKKTTEGKRELTGGRGRGTERENVTNQ